MKFNCKEIARALLSGSLLFIYTVPALAHCKDARKTCDYAFLCMRNSDIHALRIKDGVKNKNGQEVWGELAGCETAGLQLPVPGHFPNNERGFNDISAGCSNGDFVAVGKAALERRGGNTGACNQLHE
jgi:hypothetical protein